MKFDDRRTGFVPIFRTTLLSLFIPFFLSVCVIKYISTKYIDYIITSRPQYGLTRDNFRLRNGEENWAGLRRLTLASNIPDHEIKSITDIIDDASLDNETKKTRLKALDRGRTYRKMLDEVYPHLRCARYLAVYYDSSDDKAVDVINQANQLLREGQYEEALELAMTVSDDFRAYNTIAAAKMMTLDFEGALPWAERALENGSKEAQANIDAINAELQYERIKRQERERYLERFR